jgi:hypothetical protein
MDERLDWRGERLDWRGERLDWRGVRLDWRGERLDWRGLFRFFPTVTPELRPVPPKNTEF